MGRFWTMLAHYHAQLWNGSEMAASLGVAPNTARAYLDALEEILQAQQPDHAWFYAVHSGSELDLLMEIRGRRIGVEFKRADAPSATRSMHVSIADTSLDELWVVYPGTRAYALSDRITVRPLHGCLAPR